MRIKKGEGNLAFFYFASTLFPEQVLADGNGNCLGAVGRPELVEDGAQMGFDEINGRTGYAPDIKMPVSLFLTSGRGLILQPLYVV